jgi:hypothetical protein
MCAASRAEPFWSSRCDTPCDFPLRVLIVSARWRPSPGLLGPAASATVGHAAGASCARPGVRGYPCALGTGRLAGKARLAWGRSRSYGVTLGTVSLSRRHAYRGRRCELRLGYELWACLSVVTILVRRGRVGRYRLWPPCDGLSSALAGPWRSSSPVC